MPDITAISAFLASIRTATDIAGLLRKADVSLENAETKLQIAELISALADAKINASEIQDLLREKDEEIRELKEALEINVKLIRYGDAYYEKDSQGNPTGDPYCSHCWEVSHKIVHIHKVIHHNNCPLCKNTYEIHLTPKMKPK